MSSYRIGKLNGRFVLVFDVGGKRRRFRLNAKDASEAHRVAPGIFAELTRPTSKKVEDLWRAFIQDRVGRAVTVTMVYTWKALKGRFGEMEAEAITVADCRAHMAERRKTGIMDGTLLTELGHLRMVLRWAEKHKLIDRAPHIERPPQPRPKEDKHLTRDEMRRLVENSSFPHVRLAAILLYTTAARSAALRRLTWDRCDFERELIDLREPAITQPHKGRAIVPMLRTAKAALREAQPGAISGYVIEWGGKPVGSLKRGLKRAAVLAGIKKPVSPHVLRHSAAVHMAEDDVSMEKIAQFLGHSNVNTTRKIYARFSPSYLKDAAAALEFDDLGSMNRKITTSPRVK
jgi:integrase